MGSKKTAMDLFHSETTVMSLEKIKGLKNRKDRIETLHKSILIMKINQFEFAILIGKELADQKEEFRQKKLYGQFDKWTKENLPFLSRTTAFRYLKLYENEDEIRFKLGKSPELKKAYGLLSKPKEKDVSLSQTDNEIIDRVDETLKSKIRTLKKKPKWSRAKRIEKRIMEKALTHELSKREKSFILPRLPKIEKADKKRLEKDLKRLETTQKVVKLVSQ